MDECVTPLKGAENAHYGFYLRLVSSLVTIASYEEDFARCRKLLAKAEPIIKSGNYDGSVSLDRFYAARLEASLMMLYPDKYYLESSGDLEVMQMARADIDRINDEEWSRMA